MRRSTPGNDAIDAVRDLTTSYAGYAAPKARPARTQGIGQAIVGICLSKGRTRSTIQQSNQVVRDRDQALCVSGTDVSVNDVLLDLADKGIHLIDCRP